MKIGELLLEAGLVDEAQIAAALRDPQGMRLGSALIAARAVDPDAVARTLAQQLGVPPAKAEDLIAPTAAARAAVPEALCRRLWVVPYALHGNGQLRVLEVAMRDPEDQAALNELKVAAGMRIDARVAPELWLREALHPRGELPAARPAAPGGGDNGLELDDRVPRATHGRRGAARYTGAPANAPAGAGAAAGPGSGAAIAGAAGANAVPLPPLRYDNAPSQTASKVTKLVFTVAAIVAIGYVVIRFKKCMTSTTQAVGAHYDSKLLGLGIDFPESGWRVAPKQRVDLGAARSEYFYRGGIPEAPVVTMVLARGPAEDVGTAAQRALGDLVKDTMTIGCEASPDRAAAIVCRGGGSLTLFGRKRANVMIEVHAWNLSTGELAMAVWLNPDHTLSETAYVLSSIVEQ